MVSMSARNGRFKALADTYGDWTVVGHTRIPPGARVLCKCVCGTSRLVKSDSLRSGASESCGCTGRAKTAAANLGVMCPSRGRPTHGLGGTRTYYQWWRMVQRCTNPKSLAYPRYGAVGIKVCDRWLNSVLAFFNDMGHCPSRLHSVDRIDNSKGYEPGNCRWATRDEQQRNKRNSRFVEYAGKSQCVADWAREYGLSSGCLHKRLFVKGWDMERALTTPSRRKQKAC